MRREGIWRQREDLVYPVFITRSPGIFPHVLHRSISNPKHANSPETSGQQNEGMQLSINHRFLRRVRRDSQYEAPLIFPMCEVLLTDIYGKGEKERKIEGDKERDRER